MRIVLVLHTDSPRGGGSQVFRSVIPRMLDAGCDLRVIVRDEKMGADSLHAWLSELGVPFELMDFRWWCNTPERILRRPWLGLRARQINARVDERIARLLEQWRPDALVVFDGVMGVGYDPARRLGIPSVGYLQEVPGAGHGMRFYSEREVRRKLAATARCVAISSYVRSGWTHVVEPSHVDVIPNGIAEGHVWREGRGYVHAGVVRVTLAGSVVPTKGQLLLVEAVERLLAAGETHISVRLLGARPEDPSAYEGQVRARLAEGPAGGCVELLPYDPDIARVWGATDVVVSCSEAEGFGLALAEGMASGCLAVGPDCGAVPELLADGRGLLYARGDADDLARKLARAAELVRTRPHEAVAAGQAYASGLSGQAQCDALLNLLRDL